MKNWIITEGSGGTRFYHLSDPAFPRVSLCGVRVMGTSLPVDSWGIVGHLGERYCSRCEVESVRKQPTTAGPS